MVIQIYMFPILHMYEQQDIFLTRERDIYGRTMNHLPPRDKREVSSETEVLVVLLPIITRLLGHSRNNRDLSGERQVVSPNDSKSSTPERIKWRTF